LPAQTNTVNAGQPGPGKWIDAAAALVPAEVLALHAFALTYVTGTGKGSNGKDITTITKPDTLKWTFIALCVLSVIIYVAGHVNSWDKLDYGRMLIPPAAFTAWVMLQTTSAWTVIDHDMSDATRAIAAAILAALLAVIATALAYKADAQT
jgi:hypothetical protein